MNFLTNAFKRFRTDKRITFASLAALVVFGGFMVIENQAATEDRLRKSPAATEFESNPETWLLNPKSVAEFRVAVDGGLLRSVGQAASPPNLLLYTLKSGATASVRIPNCNTFVCAGTILGRLEDQSAAQGFSFVRVDVDPRGSSQRTLDTIKGLVAPMGTLIFVCGAMFVLFRMQSSTGAASQLSERPSLRFHDVVGSTEAKSQLNRVLTFLNDPKAYERIGARAPRGVLLVGPPGTGKTLLAKALAGESNANFIAVDGSYFTSMFYGAGITKVKSLFDLARKSAPVVLFIDEIDGISKRTSTPGMGGADSETNRIINRILVEMDGFEGMDDVIVVGATNHESNVDEALRRPGRFDVLVRMTLPTLPDRKALFELYLNKVTRDPEIDTNMLARMTAGVSPAEIENLVNKASSRAAETRAEFVSTTHLIHVIETLRMGGDVSPMKELLTEETRIRLAYHESGHALVAHLLGVGTVEHLTIEPRGEALGVTYVTRETEDPLYKESELSSRIAMILGGRESELLMLNSVSSGAADDLKKATELAFSMVSSFGFSKEFGVLSVAGIPKELLGPGTQAAVLSAARELLEQSQKICHGLLRTNRNKLEELARCLLEKEVLTGSELQALLGSRSEVGELLPA